MDDRDEFREAIVFRGSLTTNVLYEILFVILLAFAPYILLSSTSTYRQLVGAVSVPVMLWLATRIACNLYRGRRAIVAIGKRGLFDWRVSNAWVPWAAITRIDEAAPDPYLGWRRYGVTIQVDPGFLSSFPEKRLSRIMRVVNERLGLPGLTITLAGVDAKFDQIKAALALYCPQWRQISTDDVRK